MATRRTFLAGSLFAGLMGLGLGSAQQSTPSASPVAIPPDDAEKLLNLLTPTPVSASPSDFMGEILELANITGYVTHQSRLFAAVDVGFESLFLGGFLTAMVVGIEFDTDGTASDALTPLVGRAENFMRDWWSESSADGEYQGAESNDISVGRLGDERESTVLTASIDNELVDSFVATCIAVRQDRWVQLLIGAGISGVTDPLIRIAEALIDRWPTNDLADMLPELDDMPPGMAIVAE